MASRKISDAASKRKSVDSRARSKDGKAPKHGFPTRADGKLGKAVADRIRDGNSQSGACTAEGIPPSTHWEWMAKGRDGDADYWDYFAEVTAGLEERCADVLGEKDPNGRYQSRGEWIASKLHKTAWGEIKQVELSGRDGKPIESAAVPLTPESARFMREELLGIGKGKPHPDDEDLGE